MATAARTAAAMHCKPALLYCLYLLCLGVACAAVLSLRELESVSRGDLATSKNGFCGWLCTRVLTMKGKVSRHQRYSAALLGTESDSKRPYQQLASHHPSGVPISSMSAMPGGGGEVYSFVTCLCRATIDHPSPPTQGAVPTSH